MAWEGHYSLPTIDMNDFYSFKIISIKVHVRPEAEVADHCRKFALSHPDQRDFKQPCDHQHKVHCDRCTALDKVKGQIYKTGYSFSVFDLYTYISYLRYENTGCGVCVLCWKGGEAKSANAL